MKRKHGALSASGGPPSVQGHTCKICNAIGEHLEDACPAKTLVHLPRTFRKEVADKTVAAIRETFMTPPNYVPGAELVPLLRGRTDVPPELQCASCTQLAHDAIWCACCNIIACAACLGPPNEPYVCPQCADAGTDTFHVVNALRGLETAWLRAMTRFVDLHTFQAGVAVSGPAAKTPTRQYNATP